MQFFEVHISLSVYADIFSNRQVGGYFFFAWREVPLIVQAVVSILLVILYWKHVRAICWHGDLCPGKVVSVNPLRVAVYTDLTQYGKPFEVIKIIETPVMTFGFRKPEVGERVGCVAVYQASQEYAERWANFSPKPVLCLTFSRGKVERTVGRISDELWDELDRNLEMVEERAETIGLYHFGEMVSDN